MPGFGLNQMTVPGLPVEAVLDLARATGCVGVELRNDLGRPLFDGQPPEAIAAQCADAGLALLAVAEVKAFNAPDRDDFDDARALAALARVSGARGVALIPQVTDAPVPRADQRAALRRALVALRPILEAEGVTGLIEPLGFPTSSLRYKADVAEVLAALGDPGCFALVHDTFHHHLAGETEVFAPLTGLVHISGVTDPAPGPDQMTDAHRVLVDADDRLGNIAQLRALDAQGHDGPVSFEAFSPRVHAMPDPASALAGSMSFITSQLAGVPA